MPNVVLERLIAQRQQQLDAMDAVLSQVDARGNDMVDAERQLLEAARGRIAELDAQIGPLEAFEELRGQHEAAIARLPGPDPQRGRPDANGDRVPAQPRRIDGSERMPEYRSVGAYLVDLLASRGLLRQGDVPDRAAAERIAQMRAPQNQTTVDTPGILPTPIVGQVVNLIDANRPLISSLGGGIPMGGIPGKTFSRPKITQHTDVGVQPPAEKTDLPSRKMVITPVTFTKQTYGGTVDISRQDIDWTSPSAWDILIRDLADVYAVQTETAVAAAFKAAAGELVVPVDDTNLEAWSAALYQAAASSYAGGKRMPDRLWVSLNVWAALGALVDTARLVLPPNQAAMAGGAGESELGSFRGDVLGLPRIVVPTFADDTCIIGPANLYEVYEEVIGLLSVVEPSILGVTVAYGGYTAWGTLAGPAFVPVTPPAGTPLLADIVKDPALAAALGPAPEPAAKAAKNG